MLDREEFETLFLILYKKWEKWGKHTSAYGVGWDIWQAQQKKIDALKAENFAMSAMLCKHPNKRTLNEYYDSTYNYCDELKSLNPDVPCPVCEGKGGMNTLRAQARPAVQTWPEDCVHRGRATCNQKCSQWNNCKPYLTTGAPWPEKEGKAWK